MEKLIIGIDPGLNGAICRIMDNLISFHAMPIFTVGKKKEIDLTSLAAILSPAENCAYVMVAIEKVHSMPKQGVASSFKFGKGYDSILGILAAHKMPYIEIAPQTWKKAMLPDMAKGKESAVYRALQINPGLFDGPHLNKIQKIAQAEAFLIAQCAQPGR